MAFLREHDEQAPSGGRQGRTIQQVADETPCFERDAVHAGLRDLIVNVCRQIVDATNR
ncbi:MULTISPECIES: hypothetical protein [Burkholderia]|uniref:hypothetical protein n=1 Tax=Burkholderia TaxID=32008 RepID=UPI001582CACE|nr:MULTISPECIES: hypothetical protein [Burkholderia]